MNLKNNFSLAIQPNFIQTVGSASPESGSGYRLYNTLPAGLTKCKTDSDCEPNKFCRFNKESRGPKSMEETLQASTNDLDTSN